MRQGDGKEAILCKKKRKRMEILFEIKLGGIKNFGGGKEMVVDDGGGGDGGSGGWWWRRRRRRLYCWWWWWAFVYEC